MTKTPWPFFQNTNYPKPKHIMINTFNESRKALVEAIESERQTLLSDAKRNGVSIVHVFNELDPKGGLTIAFRKSMPNQVSTNMVDVSIAVCSHADTFSRKIGTFIALQKWFNNDMVQLPLSTGWADEDLNGIVKRKFTAMHFTA